MTHAGWGTSADFHKPLAASMWACMMQIIVGIVAVKNNLALSMPKTGRRGCIEAWVGGWGGRSKAPYELSTDLIRVAWPFSSSPSFPQLADCWWHMSSYWRRLERAGVGGTSSSSILGENVPFPWPRVTACTRGRPRGEAPSNDYAGQSWWWLPIRSGQPRGDWAGADRLQPSQGGHRESPRQRDSRRTLPHLPRHSFSTLFRSSTVSHGLDQRLSSAVQYSRGRYSSTHAWHPLMACPLTSPHTTGQSGRRAWKTASRRTETPQRLCDFIVTDEPVGKFAQAIPVERVGGRAWHGRNFAVDQSEGKLSMWRGGMLTCICWLEKKTKGKKKTII